MRAFDSVRQSEENSVKSTESTHAEATSQSYERLATLDVLRGLALFGIFMVNVQFMAQPLSLAMEAPDSGALDFGLWMMVKTLFVSKFVGIFSLLFGVGFALQHQRAREAGRPFNGMYALRSVLLMGIGLVHGIFLFEGDILLPYSVAGLLMLTLQGLSPRALKIASLICVLLAMLSTGVVQSFDGDWEEDTAAAISAHLDGDLGALISHRGIAYAAWMFLSSVIGFNWRILCAFFLGSALLRTGFFGRGDKRKQRNFAAWTLAIGLLSEVGLTYLVYTGSSVAVRAFSEGAHELTSMILAMGYVGVVRFLVNHGAPRFVERVFGWVACAGRIALTNYLLQSALSNVYFTFIGFGWYGALDQRQLVLIVTATFIGQVVLSVFWMKHFRAGPLEWAWRSATKRELLPFRRRAHGAPA